MHPTTNPTTNPTAHPTAHPTMLSVGLDPMLAETSPSAAFPELDHDTILAAADAAYAELRALGFTIDRCLVDDGATASAVYRAALAEKSYDYIAIGAGIRLDPERTLLFETLVNISVELDPSATLVFDTGPATKAEAIRRWFPGGRTASAAPSSARASTTSPSTTDRSDRS